MPAPRPSAPDKLQLLGVAFASADLAFELDPDGSITFAIGAVRQVLGLEADQIVGRNWREVIDPTHCGTLGLILEDLGPGERRAAIRANCISLDQERGVTAGELAIFRLPDRRRRISCAFRRGHPDGSAGPPRETGLLDRKAFEAAARAALVDPAASGAPLHLDLVELPGFEASRQGLPRAAGEQARQDVIDALRASSYGGYAAAELATDRFALVRATDAAPMISRLGRIAGADIKTSSHILAPGAAPPHSLRALRFALDRHIEAGPDAAGVTFQSVLDATLRQAQEFIARLARGDVALVFQPVVDLATRQLHHFEALTRFSEDSSPQEVIELAEELQLITELDLAVFASVTETLGTLASVRIAVNLSGHSLVEPGLVDKLLALTKGRRTLCSRLLVEITETHALKDLDAANVLVGRLRRAGHIVCLDDFGAGAASLDYLRRLEVDIVKIDGRYIRSIKDEPRTQMVVRHMGRLCRDMGIQVVAEMIEDEATARLVGELGATFGQGWLFGKPTPSLEWPGSPS